MRWPSHTLGMVALASTLLAVPVGAQQALTPAQWREDLHGWIARIKERLNRVRSPFRSAEHFEIEDIIDPRDTRPNLCRWVNLAWAALRPGSQGFTYRP